MNKPLILVVEDDPSVRNLITTTLKTNDYRYVVAPNGSTAIMEATSHNPEIILLDLHHSCEHREIPRNRHSYCLQSVRW